MDIVRSGRHYTIAAGPTPMQCRRIGDIYACARRTSPTSADVVVAAPTTESGVYLYATVIAPPGWIDACALAAQLVRESAPDAPSVDLGGHYQWPIPAGLMVDDIPEVGWLDDILGVAGGIAGTYFGGPAGGAAGAAGGAALGAGLESVITSPTTGTRYRYRYVPDPLPAGAIRYGRITSRPFRVEIWALATAIARRELMAERGVSDFGWGGLAGINPLDGNAEAREWRDRMPTDADVAARRDRIVRTYALFRDNTNPNRVHDEAGQGASALLSLVGAALAAQQGQGGAAAQQALRALGGLAQQQGASGAAGGLNAASALLRQLGGGGAGTTQAGGTGPAGGATTAPALQALLALLGTGATTPNAAGVLGSAASQIGGAAGAFGSNWGAAPSGSGGAFGSNWGDSQAPSQGSAGAFGSNWGSAGTQAAQGATQSAQGGAFGSNWGAAGQQLAQAVGALGASR